MDCPTRHKRTRIYSREPVNYHFVTFAVSVTMRSSVRVKGTEFGKIFQKYSYTHLPKISTPLPSYFPLHLSIDPRSQHSSLLHNFYLTAPRDSQPRLGPFQVACEGL